MQETHFFVVFFFFEKEGNLTCKVFKDLRCIYAAQLKAPL